MNFVKIWGILKAILPTKKIGAWILGVLAALVALVMGVANTDLKEQFCATKDVVELPKLEMKADAPPANSPVLEEK